MSPLVVGLTGGIASGKSLVSHRFEQLGIPVADADLVARTMVAPGSAGLKSVANEFGTQFLTSAGELDRRMMREHIFANEPARRVLEAILHPLIFDELKQWRDAQTSMYCVISAAILLESGMKSLVNRVLVVDCEESEQLQRLTTRDDIGERLGREMIDAQAPRASRLAAADDVLHNDASPKALLTQVDLLHEKYLELAASVRESGGRLR